MSGGPLEAQDRENLLRRSNQLYKSGRLEEALAEIGDKTEEFSGVANFFLLRGLILSGLNEHNLAVKDFLEAVKIDPLDPISYTNIGDCLSKNLQFDEAEKYFNLALTVSENYFEAVVGLGVVAFQRLDYTSCERYFEQALKIKPDHVTVLTNLGNCYSVQGKYDEALILLNKAIAREKDNSLARTNRALIKLGRGQFETGWEDYEYRWDSGNFMANRFQDLPRWTGPKDKPQNVLIWSEQGLGDEIMFASIFNDLQGLKEKFFVECDPRLYNLFKGSFSHLEFIPKGLIKDVSPIRSQIPLASLGRIFRRSKKSFPRKPGGFLKPTGKELQPTTIEMLEKLPRPWIGVSWESYALTSNFRGRKSIMADTFSDLTRRLEGSLINLQFPNPHKHEENKKQDIPDKVISLAGINLKNDIEHLATLLNRLDNVITIGNSVAHLCGSLGVEATVLLPKVPDWRWGYSGDESIWYQSLHIQRCRELGWAELLLKI